MMKSLTRILLILGIVLGLSGFASAADLPFQLIISRECPERDSLGTFIKATLIEGLDKVKTINSGYVADRLANIHFKKVLITCDDADGAVSDTNMSGRTPKIRLGVLSFRLNDLFNHPENLKYEISPEVGIKNVIFHEILHVLKFDNLTPEMHNNGYRPDDVVYSCAYFAFPHSYLNSIDIKTATAVCAAATTP
jgi:hypothetical protein